MTQKSSLLQALRNYRPRDKSDPLENFVTEAFVWLLQNHPRFGRFYLGKISKALGILPVADSDDAVWFTRMNLNGVFPDLVCEAGGRAFLFEHKIWSPLHNNQLESYRSRAIEKYGEGASHLILVVGGTSQIDGNPDLSRCWRDIYRWIQEWEEHVHYEPDFLFSDFRSLLESEGLGPPAPISHEAIVSFKPSQNFELNLSKLVERVVRHDWKTPTSRGVVEPVLPGHYNSYWGDDKQGRMGFHLTGEEWNPGVFVGFYLYDTMRVGWRNPICPDFSIILDIRLSNYPDYHRLPSYEKMRDELQQLLVEQAPEFEFLDHLSSHPDPDCWHPIHIRLPMIELFRGTVDAGEQEQRFIGQASRVLGVIWSCASFWDFRSELIRQDEMRELSTRGPGEGGSVSVQSSLSEISA